MTHLHIITFIVQVSLDKIIILNPMKTTISFIPIQALNLLKDKTKINIPLQYMSTSMYQIIQSKPIQTNRSPKNLRINKILHNNLHLNLFKYDSSNSKHTLMLHLRFLRKPRESLWAFMWNQCWWIKLRSLI